MSLPSQSLMMDGLSSFSVTSPCGLIPAGLSELFCSSHFCPFDSLWVKACFWTGLHILVLSRGAQPCVFSRLQHTEMPLSSERPLLLRGLPWLLSQGPSFPTWLPVFLLCFIFLCRVHHCLWVYCLLSASLLYQDVNTMKVELWLIHSCNSGFWTGVAHSPCSKSILGGSHTQWDQYQ